MQEDFKKIKRFNALKIALTFVLVLVFFASLVLSVCAPIFFSNGVASAYDASLPNSGVVGDNLFKDSTINVPISSTISSTGDVSLVRLQYGTYLNLYNSADNEVVVDNSYFSCSNSAVFDRLWFDFDYGYVVGETYTFSIGFRCSRSARLRVSNGDGTKVFSAYNSVGDLSNQILTVSFVYSGSNSCRFLIYFSDKFYLDWMKLENGSSFTGYVPNFNYVIDSQKDTVANYNFSSRFVTPINNPSRQVYFNLNRYPVVPAKKYFKSPSSANWYYMNYFYEYDLDGGQFGGNYATNLGWEVYYNAGADTSFYKAVLKCNGTAIFQYDCTGSSFDTIVYSNPTWLVASNMQYNGVSIYCFDFSGSSHYYTLPDTSTLLDEQFSNSCWAYSFALQDLNSWKDLANDVYYNNGYNNGFSEGKENGFSAGKESGYKEGFSAGKENGYDIGYSEGVSAGQDYSFSALFGAVFDVPIQAFKGLFNFEIFGVNMTSFVSSLLALCVIVVIVKICLGGK